MVTLRIEYCHECMFLGRALEIAKMALERYPSRLGSVELIRGRDGVFTVTLDDVTLFSIGEEGRPPSVDAIDSLLSQHQEMGD